MPAKMGAVGAGSAGEPGIPPPGIPGLLWQEGPGPDPGKET